MVWSPAASLHTVYCGKKGRKSDRGELKKCQKCTGTQQRPTVLCWSRHPHTSTSTCRTLALVTWASLFSRSPPRCCSPDPGHWELCNCTTHDVISRSTQIYCVHLNILTSSTASPRPAAMGGYSSFFVSRGGGNKEFLVFLRKNNFK